MTNNISVTIRIFTAVILAGGEARRMGGEDKGLVELSGKPMVQHVIDSMSSQVGYLVINANRHFDTYARFGCPVVADEFEGFCGPLAGMASGMRTIDTPYMVTVPCDSPLVPDDLVKRLYLELVREKAEISVAHDGDRMHPVFSLMQTRLLDSMLAYLKSGERKIDKWFRKHRLAITDFSDKPETFLNVNTPEELATLATRLQEQNQ
ncbi:MAG TPA: molybdenum cofactor guanylyltransferase MobA [Gammaproteobacteria bacterium]|nr:molybdenum cofactor guanylyltransferase MobA [Gammaproteobacteria bacterium]